MRTKTNHQTAWAIVATLAFAGFTQGQGNVINPITGLPLITQPTTPFIANGLKRFPKPPAPKNTVSGQYNLKNGKIITGKIAVITPEGVLIRLHKAKSPTRYPLYYMYPSEITRDTRILNTYLIEANKASPAFYNGFCLFHGYGRAANIGQSLKYFEHAATKDAYLPAAHYLQWIHQSGDANSQINLQAAAKWQRVGNIIAQNKNANDAATKMAQAGAINGALRGQHVAGLEQTPGTPAGTTPAVTPARPQAPAAPARRNIFANYRGTSLGALQKILWGKSRRQIEQIFGGPPKTVHSLNSGIDYFVYRNLNIILPDSNKIITSIAIDLNTKNDMVTGLKYTDDQGSNWTVVNFR